MLVFVYVCVCVCVLCSNLLHLLGMADPSEKAAAAAAAAAIAAAAAAATSAATATPMEEDEQDAVASQQDDVDDKVREGRARFEVKKVCVLFQKKRVSKIVAKTFCRCITEE